MLPVQLWIGDIRHLRTQVREYIDTYLSRVAYDDNGCGYHSNLTWIPLAGRQQRREDIQELFAVTTYARSYEDPYIIVLEHADCLTHAAANSMLKLLEEPPSGYYMILLAQSEDGVLATIRSRCYIHRYVSEQAYQHHPLYQYITHNIDTSSVRDVHTTIEEHVPREHETRVLVENALGYWMQQYRDAVYRAKQHRIRSAEQMLNILRTSLHYIPMSGNVKLFWRMLVCQIRMREERR